MKVSRRGAALLAAAGFALAGAGPAHAAIQEDPAPAALAGEIVGDPSLVDGAAYVHKAGSGSVGVADTALAGMPTDGEKYGIVSTGRASTASAPNTSGSTGTGLGGGPVRGNTDRDVTVVRIDVNLPEYVNCLTGIDFRFLSEEYPEWVGSSYNDAFIAEVDQSTWSTSGSQITAARNFAFDPEGNPMTINAAGVTSMKPEFAQGTTFDGATPLLSAATPITPGKHSIYLSIFDQGDSAYDSAVFVDNLRFGRVADVQRDCKAGAVLARGGKHVGLGDSYSSGFGMGDYYEGTNSDDNDCQRSRKAFAPLVADEVGLSLDFHACQGAVTKDFYEPRNGGDWGEQPQLNYLGPDTGLVTYSIGGNDAGFADVLAECILGFELLPFNTCYGDDKVTEPIAEAFARLDGRASAPADITPYDTLNGDVRERTPFATRVAVAYPPLFRAEGGDRTFLPGGRCEGVKKADQRWMVEKTLEMNEIMRRSALRNGMRFADARDRFAGHELCGEDDEWFYGLTSGGRMHPTAPGHRAIADEILEVLEQDDRPRFLVKPLDTETYDFWVDALDELLSLFSEWPGSDVEMTLISPSGKRYTRSDPGPGVEHGNGPTWERFLIRDPEPGRWKVELYGKDVDPAGEETILTVHTEQAPNQRPVGRIDWHAEGDEIVLSATRSSDPDGEITGHDWYVATGDEDEVHQGPTLRLPRSSKPRAVTLVVTDDDGTTDFVYVTIGGMDIRPDSDPNPLNPRSKGVLPVAIPSTADFDATTLDASTLRLGPGGAAPKKSGVHEEDVNGDGRTDLLLQFPVPAIEATRDTTSLRLTGTLPDGREFAAEDTVRIVG